MPSKKVKADLDFGGRTSATNMRQPLAAEDAATRGFVMQQVEQITPPENTDPGDLMLLLQNAMV